MINLNTIMGAIVLFLVALVVFREKFILVVLIGVAVIILLVLIRLTADFYWYNKDKGW